LIILDQTYFSTLQLFNFYPKVYQEVSKLAKVLKDKAVKLHLRAIINVKPKV